MIVNDIMPELPLSRVFLFRFINLYHNYFLYSAIFLYVFFFICNQSSLRAFYIINLLQNPIQHLARRTNSHTYFRNEILCHIHIHYFLSLFLSILYFHLLNRNSYLNLFISCHTNHHLAFLFHFILN